MLQLNTIKSYKSRSLTEETFVLRFDRGNIQFKAGQHIVVGLKGESDLREYSVYSGEKDDYLEILVREVVDGTVSIQLKHCKPGQLLQVNGPFGSFGIENIRYVFAGNRCLLHQVPVFPRFIALSGLIPGLTISFFMESGIIMRRTTEMSMIRTDIFCVLQKKAKEDIKEGLQSFYLITRLTTICYFMCAAITI